MRLPPPLKKVQPGAPVTAEWANSIVDAIMARTPQPSADLGVQQSRSGFWYYPKRRTAGGGGGSGTCGALSVSVSEVSEGEWRAFVAPGYVNNLMPEIGGLALDYDPAPSLAVNTDGVVYAAVDWTPSSVAIGVGNYAISGGTISSAVSISFAASVPADVAATIDTATGAATGDGTSHFILAAIAGSGSPTTYAITTKRPGHRWVTVCGNDQVNWHWGGC